MARRRGGLSDEEAALVKAQTAAVARELALKEAQLQQERELTQAKLGTERDIEGQKLGFGREELSQKDRTASLGAALNALELGSKESTAREVATANQMGDLIAHRTDITPDVLASTLAGSGRPELYNALATKKARERDTTIGQLVPAMLKAKSDDERNKLGAAFEGAYPGITKDAISKAFPKEGGFTASKPELYQGGATSTTAVNTGSWSALAGNLLGKAGINPGTADVAGGLVSQNGFPILPNTPETRYNELGQGSLEGSQRVEGGIRTPSGGFIGGTLGDERLSKLIMSPTAASVTNAGNATAPVDNTPMFRGAGAGSSWAENASQLLVGPTPTPTVPQVASQPNPSATPTGVLLTPEMLALLQKRQNAY